MDSTIVQWPTERGVSLQIWNWCDDHDEYNNNDNKIWIWRWWPWWWNDNHKGNLAIITIIKVAISDLKILWTWKHWGYLLITVFHSSNLTIFYFFLNFLPNFMKNFLLFLSNCFAIMAQTCHCHRREAAQNGEWLHPGLMWWGWVRRRHMRPELFHHQ